MHNYVRLEPFMTISTAGHHLLHGTGKGAITSIVTGSQGHRRSVRLPAVIAPGVGKHLFSPVDVLTKGVSTGFCPDPNVAISDFKIPISNNERSTLHYIDLKIV